MGLDLVLEKRINDNMTMEEELDNELAYGRKTWAIANFFKRRCEAVCGDLEYILNEEAWNDFIKAVDALGNESFREKVESYLDYEQEDDIYDEDYKVDYLFLEDWLNRALDSNGNYTLGFEWELDTVVRWYDADEEVRKAFDEGADIRLIVSY